jgi:hypothetical protein
VLFSAVVIWYPTQSLAPLPQLLVCGVSLGALAGLCFWRLGLPANLRREGRDRLTRLRARFFAAG